MQVARPYGLVHYAARVFCPYIYGLRSAIVGVAHYAVYAFLACMGVECVRV